MESRSWVSSRSLPAQQQLRRQHPFFNFTFPISEELPPLEQPEAGRTGGGFCIALGEGQERLFHGQGAVKACTQEHGRLP